jgi:hypothetical protein
MLMLAFDHWSSMKNIVLIVISVLICNSVAFGGDTSPAALQQQAQGTAESAKARSEVQKRGVGARVKVRLSNGTEVAGTVSKVEDASFAVTETRTGLPVTIAYAEVQRVRGPGLSRGAKIAIVLGSVLVAVAIVIGVIVANVQRHI